MNISIVDKNGVEIKDGAKVRNYDNEECTIYTSFTGELYIDIPSEHGGEPLLPYITDGNVADTLEVIK